MTMTTQRLSKTLIGAGIGALIAVIWIVFDTTAAIVLVALAALGALVGSALENPGRLIRLLERLQDR